MPAATARRVQRAKSVLDESSRALQSHGVVAFQEVEDNLALLNLTRQEFDQQTQAAQAAQRALDLATNRYTNGAVDYLEVVVSQTTALQARRAMLALKARQLMASIGLIRGLGGGWTTADLDGISYGARRSLQCRPISSRSSDLDTRTVKSFRGPHHFHDVSKGPTSFDTGAAYRYIQLNIGEI